MTSNPAATRSVARFFIHSILTRAPLPLLYFNTKNATIIAINTIANEILMTTFIPVRCLKKTLNITKLIANETTNIVMAITRFFMTSKMMPMTRKILEIIDSTFIICGLIGLPSHFYIDYITQIVPYLLTSRRRLFLTVVKGLPNVDIEKSYRQDAPCRQLSTK